MNIAEIHEPDALYLEFQHTMSRNMLVEAGNRATITIEVEPSFYAWMATTVWSDSSRSVLQVLTSSSGIVITMVSRNARSSGL